MTSISPLSSLSLHDYRTRQHSTTDNITRHSVVVETNVDLTNQSHLYCAIVTGLTGDMNYFEDEAFEAQQDMTEGYKKWWEAHGLQINFADGTTAPVDVLISEHFYNNGTGSIIPKEQLDHTSRKDPAYTSLAVYCTEELPDYVLREFIERTNNFMEQRSIDIHNIQLAQDHITTNSTIQRTERSVSFK